MARPRKPPNKSQAQTEQLAQPDDATIDLILRLTKPGEDAHLIRRRRYDQAYEVWRASERRPKSLEAWQSKLRVPYGMQTIDTAMVNINTGVPRVMVKPRHPEAELNSKAMQVIMDYYVGEDHLVDKQPVFAQQALVYGVTGAKNHWLYDVRSKQQRGWIDDQAGQPPRPVIDQHDVIIRDGPTFEPWNVYDMWWDTQARDVDTAGYIVLRSWLSKEQLLKNACTVPDNHERADCNGIYHNIDQLFLVGTSTKIDTTAQQRYLVSGGGGGFTTSSVSYKDLFEILEVWTDETVTVMGSRKVVLRNDPNPYWHGKKPIVIANTRPDFFEMQGVPETELVDHLQQAQWTLQNMTIDNLHMTVMRGVTYRVGSVTDPNALQLKPRFKWAVTDHDDIQPFEVAAIGSDVYQERARLLADMQLVTGINPYVSGSDLSSVDQNTATGVTALQEVASRLLRFKAQMLQYKGYQRTFEMWGDMIQQFMDRTQSVQITGPGNQPMWLDIGPSDVAGHFNYVLEGSEESLSRQQERGEAIALLNAFAPLAQLGFINFKPILEKVALAYDFPNPDTLFLPPQSQPATAPSQEQIDQSQQQQQVQQLQQQQQAQQQNGQAEQALAQGLQNVLEARIGDVYGARDRPIQGGIPLDPQLAAALGQIRPF